MKMNAMKTLGVPYSAAEIGNGNAELEAQGKAIAEDLSRSGNRASIGTARWWR